MSAASLPPLPLYPPGCREKSQILWKKRVGMTSEAFSKHCARDSNSTQLHFAFLSLASSDINEDTLETENAAAAAAAAFTASTHLKEAVLGRSELQLMGLGSSGAAESWGGTYCCVAGLGVLLHPCLPSEVLFGVPSMGNAALHQGCTPVWGGPGAAARWSAAALSWCGLCPCDVASSWLFAAEGCDVGFPAALVSSESEFGEQRSRGWESLKLPSPTV